ncbi:MULTISPECIES: hypothetical protein [Streptomyces]|uniref:Uncharacterized protein n=1 Tax=Streptomyces yangpuensis TaxID=1648182 RepID=A0ABY5Q872_9ACTN|nr:MULTISPECIES: hypothetical protein [Streptomyces]MBZ9599551.1 hypothetical protein [Streptomyces erythrochromogenes]UUY52651.1 hypothetical protein NRK68_35975 [Streptomyces yangpuensis]
MSDSAQQASPCGDSGPDGCAGTTTCRHPRPCTCDGDVLTGPATLAAPFLRRLQAGGVGATAGPADGSLTTDVLMFIARSLRDDGPAHLDLADCAGRLERAVDEVRGEAAWLAEHEFLAWDTGTGTEGAGVARLWVNPSVTFLPWTDPRVAAARHRFPFITTADRGMAAEEPVIIRPYDAAGWHTVYLRYLETTRTPSLALSPPCCPQGLYEARCHPEQGRARLGPARKHPRHLRQAPGPRTRT